MSPATHLWLILLKTHASLKAHAEAQVESFDLGFSDFAVLEVLLHKDSLPVNKIGWMVRLSSGSITAAVDRLQSRSLVERFSHPTDRRTRMVRLTAAGRELAARAFEQHVRAIEHASAGLTAGEQDQAAALLKRLGRYAAELEPLTPGPANPVVASKK